MNKWLTSVRKILRYLSLSNFIIVSVVIVAMIGLFVAILANSPKSYGARVGTIWKFSRKSTAGVVWSWEGTLVYGEKGQLTWDFSVLDSKVAKDIEEARDNQQTVKLDYKEVRLMSGRTETPNHVINVTNLK